MKKFKQLNYIKHITVCNQNKNKSPDVFNEKLYQILKEEFLGPKDKKVAQRQTDKKKA